MMTLGIKNKIVEYLTGTSFQIIFYRHFKPFFLLCHNIVLWKYSSDEDSDVEISDEMTADQRQVYEFLSNAMLSELLCMPNCSQKKAEAIIEQRPFTGWKNMVWILKPKY